MIKGIIILIAIVSNSVLAQLPPMPSVAESSAQDTNTSPVTYPRTVAWNAYPTATSYTLTVSSQNVQSFYTTTNNSITNVSLLEGTNKLSLIAAYGTNGQVTLPANTNFVIRWITETDCLIVTSTNFLDYPNRGTITNNLPGKSRTFGKVGARFWWLRGTVTNFTEEFHAP